MIYDNVPGILLDSGLLMEIKVLKRWKILQNGSNVVRLGFHRMLALQRLWKAEEERVQKERERVEREAEEKKRRLGSQQALDRLQGQEYGEFKRDQAGLLQMKESQMRRDTLASERQRRGTGFQSQKGREESESERQEREYDGLMIWLRKIELESAGNVHIGLPNQ